MRNDDDQYNNDPMFHAWADMICCELKRGTIDLARLLRATNMGISLFTMNMMNQWQMAAPPELAAAIRKQFTSKKEQPK